jgi:ketosteroid isomerase-like protein
MYKTLIRAMIRRSVRALQAGETAPILAGYADDAVLVFPGRSSWGGEYRGKAAISGFLERFIEAGLVGEVEDILVNGPPWRTTVCVVFTDRAQTRPGGSSIRTELCFWPGSDGARSSTKKTSKTHKKSRPSTPILRPETAADDHRQTTGRLWSEDVDVSRRQQQAPDDADAATTAT